MTPHANYWIRGRGTTPPDPTPSCPDCMSPTDWAVTAPLIRAMGLMQSNLIGFPADITVRANVETPPADLSPDATTRLGEHSLPLAYSTRHARFPPELTGEA